MTKSEHMSKFQIKTDNIWLHLLHSVWLTHLPLDKMAAILADDIFKRIFLNENVSILVQISLKFVPKGPIDNKSALVQVMAWRRQATSHYLSQWWTSSPTHIYGTRGNELNYFSVLITHSKAQIRTSITLWNHNRDSISHSEIKIRTHYIVTRVRWQSPSAVWDRGIATGVLHHFLDKGKQEI